VLPPVLDTLTIHLRRRLPGLASTRPPYPSLKIQVLLTPAGDPTTIDSHAPLRSDARPPAPAPLVFAFWDSLPAYAPVQALRRWDGAHTGPAGGRHGLYNLLRTARASRIPLFLLDLNTPGALSALDYLGGAALVHDMQSEGLLNLPAALPDLPLDGSPAAAALVEQTLLRLEHTSQAFQLSTGGMLTVPTQDWLAAGGQTASRTGLLFIRPTASPVPALRPVSLTRRSTARLLAIPTPETAQTRAQAAPDGPSLEVRCPARRRPG
jgi:hypothetical protein